MGYSIDPVSANCYSGTTVLINKFDIREEEKLNEVEGVLTSARYAEWLSAPKVETYDFDHYKAIHRFLFSDLYDWADLPKPDSKAAIAALKRLGVKKTVMLTGDSAPVAEAVAAELGLDEFHAELLPADKVSRVEELLKKETGKLAFVGDGINDAPVLTRADIGIAMGGLGSDAAIEAADVVLMDDQPSKIAVAIGIARKTVGIVHQNIVFALAVKAVVLVMGALGKAPMWLAVFADVGVAFIAILNAMRCLNVKEAEKK